MSDLIKNNQRSFARMSQYVINEIGVRNYKNFIDEDTAAKI